MHASFGLPSALRTRMEARVFALLPGLCLDAAPAQLREQSGCDSLAVTAVLMAYNRRWLLHTLLFIIAAPHCPTSACAVHHCCCCIVCFGVLACPSLSLQYTQPQLAGSNKLELTLVLWGWFSSAPIRSVFPCGERMQRMYADCTHASKGIPYSQQLLRVMPCPLNGTAYLSMIRLLRSAYLQK